ncbi:MAG TPA: hypothetical protein VMT89_07695 [Candidatus Acidoferrales bacterium]|nr:hypothetical protein [Candidatus Acidoferrales bacterium]
MAKVYDALKRLEEERTLLEQSARAQTRSARKQAPSWSTWFRRGRQEEDVAAPEPDHQFLDRLEKLASDVEAVRIARRTNASDVDARIEALNGQLQHLEVEVKQLEVRLASAANNVADGVRSRLAEVGNRLLLVGAISVLALLVALLRA